MPSPLQSAIELHRSGRLPEAATVYETVLQAEPWQIDALHLLGVLSHQLGKHQQAVELIGKAIALQPDVASFHASLAEAYRSLGQLERAVNSAETALKFDPDLAEAANNLGLALLDQGQTERAIEAFQTALESNSEEALIHNNLGNAFRLQGDTAEAIRHFRRALDLDNSLALAHSNLGQMLLEQYRRRPALTHCRAAVRLVPEFAEGHCNLGNVLRELGHLNEARDSYNEALRLNPGLALAYNNMGQLLQEEGNPREAINWYQEALQREPNSARIHTNLGSAFVEQDRYDEAISRYRFAVQIDPDHVEAHNGLGYVLHDQGQYQDAIAEYQEVIRLQPNHAQAHCNLGTISEELGKLDEARTYFRQTVELDPDHAGGYSQLATMLRDKLPEPDLQAMQRLLNEKRLGQGRRAALLFGMAQYRDASGDFAEAGRCLEEANALCENIWEKRGTKYDAQMHERFVDGLCATYTPGYFERVRGWGLDTERPIFIVGLPRSGTTLTEQILASHSKVFGAGELCFASDSFHSLPQIVGRQAPPLACVDQLNRSATRRAGESHLQRLGQINPEAERIVDKMPENYLYLGHLATMFPKARFIHCRRDLRDVAVSCWITNFRQIRWAANQDNIAARFADYRRLMDHWKKALPVPMLEIEYEDTVADLERVARRLIAWCGLKWEPACLDFHKSSRPVRTASVTQVRQPIYNRSVARWKHYEPALGKLFTKLEQLEGSR